MRVSVGILLGLGLLAGLAWRVVLWMPGPAWPPGCGPLDVHLGRTESGLRSTVAQLAAMGPRSASQPDALREAAQYVELWLRTAHSASPLGASWEVRAETFGPSGEFANVVAETRGTELPLEIVTVGAHYDTVPTSPGADDNASGVAALVELTRLLAQREPRRSLRLIAFPNEELPIGDTELSGSRVAAAAARARGDDVVAMLSLESLGYWSDAPGSQRHPGPLGMFFPDRADFLAWIADLRSRALLHRALAAFRASGRLPAEGLAAPASLVPDIRRSDHAPYWEQGYPALLVTGTAEFRNPHYHGPGDLAETLDYGRLARATAGLAEVVECLANGSV
jgi:hypothetical protein